MMFRIFFTALILSFSLLCFSSDGKPEFDGTEFDGTEFKGPPLDGSELDGLDELGDFGGSVASFFNLSSPFINSADQSKDDQAKNNHEDFFVGKSK